MRKSKTIIIFLLVLIIALIYTINSIKITNITNNLVTYKVLGLEFNYYVEK